ncbi:MAG: TetR/AcrR family transcriptional regulator [Desulfobacteraceae bacterium]|nr:TetR/AcrR family transcriptional regulator [Desulfobacteraceae bacterium]MCB9494085.1 TetR/AcrR family transcriptional regulator [Desulfobacteraceae bacterium]
MSIKEKIIDESLKLFSVKGFMTTSVTDIIQAAGTSKGGFYNHFKSKEDLYFATLSRARKLWREKNLSGTEEIERPLEKIKKILENYRDNYLADQHNFPGGCIFINLSVELNDQAPKLAQEVNKGFERLKNMFRNLLDEEKKRGGLAEGVNTRKVTEMIFSGLLGACVMYTADKSKENLDYTIASLTDHLSQIQK